MSRRHDALVIGGGLAGAAFATRLADAGRDVVVIEREAGPHDKVCGEFLSHEAMFYLDALGVDLAALGAVPIRRLSVSRGALSIVRRLPFEAASLSRRVLDEALLRRASETGAAVARGQAVRRLERTADGWTAHLQDGTTVSARACVLACGKHDMRDHARPTGVQNDLIGLKAHLRLSNAASDQLRDTVLIGLFPGGYAGLEPIEDGRANLCLVVRRSQFAACGRDWAALTEILRASAVKIDRALEGAVAIHERPLAVSRIPYGMVIAESGDGCWRLGDQAAVVPSFAGEGMSMALHSARLAADVMIEGGSASRYQARFAADVGTRVRMAAALSQAITAAPTQALAMILCRMFPPSLSVLAKATRIRSAALD